VDAVVERRLELRMESRTVQVVASLTKPKEVAEDEWTCACVTRLGDEVRTTDIHGGDSMQALQLAVVTLGGQLKHEARWRGGTLFHFDEPFNSLLAGRPNRRRLATKCKETSECQRL